MIKALDFIKTGFSADDANELDKVIQPLFERGEKIVVDFEGIKIFTTLFFNNVFAKYILTIGPETYQECFALENLSELGQTTYQHSFDNAVNYYKLSDAGKQAQNTIVEDPE